MFTIFGQSSSCKKKIIFVVIFMIRKPKLCSNWTINLHLKTAVAFIYGKGSVFTLIEDTSFQGCTFVSNSTSTQLILRKEKILYPLDQNMLSHESVTRVHFTISDKTLRALINVTAKSHEIVFLFSFIIKFNSLSVGTIACNSYQRYIPAKNFPL